MSDRKLEARPGSLDSALDASIIWRYVAPMGHTLEMCLKPTYWRNVLRELGQQRVIGRHAFNRIEILSEDGSWEAELRVMEVDATGGLVTTRLLRQWPEAKPEAVAPAPKAETKPETKADVPEGYIVEQVPGNGWRAIDPNGDVLTEKRTTEAAALKAAVAHAKKAGGN